MPIKPGKIVQVRGIQVAIRALERLRDTAVPTVRQGLYDAANRILILAKFYCPKDTHALVNSGQVRVSENLGTGSSQLRAWVTFGGVVGKTTPGGGRQGLTTPKGGKTIKDFEPHHLQGQVVYYAVYVHENLTARHAPPTQAKFLERAVRESLDAIPPMIAGPLEEMMGRLLQQTVSTATRPGTGKPEPAAIKGFGRLKIPPPAAPPG